MTRMSPKELITTVRAAIAMTKGQPMTADAKLLSDLIPTNWLDPLLSGKDAVIRDMPCSGHDIERLLAAIKRRVAEAERAHEYVHGEPWLPMLTAPLDGTEVQLMVRHFDYFTALKMNGQEAADGMYQGAVIGKWIDHNGGGWTWSGHAGSPVAWRPLHQDRRDISGSDSK